MKHLRFKLWQDSDERPYLDTYILEGQRQRPLVLVLPGGGYGFTSEREAEPIALQFTAAGFHAAVLHYSVHPVRHPMPLRDAAKAMCVLRQQAAEWQIAPDQIAVCGFSAGGHLAASLGVHCSQSYVTAAPGVSYPANRPNALILGYPVISSGPHRHQGSFDHLLGPEATAELRHQMSLEHQVSPDTPPTFLWHTGDDSAVPVENSLLFAASLRRAGVPFELHVYPHGPHGLSLATPETDNGEMGSNSHVATWMQLCVQWLQQQFASQI